jgi:hypothetical protein
LLEWLGHTQRQEHDRISFIGNWYCTGDWYRHIYCAIVTSKQTIPRGKLLAVVVVILCMFGVSAWRRFPSPVIKAAQISSHSRSGRIGWYLNRASHSTSYCYPRHMSSELPSPSKRARSDMSSSSASSEIPTTVVETLLSEQLRNLVRTNVVGGTIASAVPESPEADAVYIGTHDGSFHCDEALAVSMLKLLPAYADATIVRSRNPAVLSACNIIVDVGAVYDPSTHRYDHHQRGFTEVMEPGRFDTKLSSAGLVYKHFGKDILRHLLSTVCAGAAAVDEGLVDRCFHKIYANFIEHIDAIDNGISVLPDPNTQAPMYRVSTTLSDRIHWLNPDWNQPVSIFRVLNWPFANC